GWLCALEYLVNVYCRAAIKIIDIGRIAHKPTRLHILLEPKHSRESPLERQLGQALSVLLVCNGRGQGEKAINILGGQCGHCGTEIIHPARRYRMQPHCKTFGSCLHGSQSNFVRWRGRVPQNTYVSRSRNGFMKDFQLLSR